jgi:hypothetical protein
MLREEFRRLCKPPNLDFAEYGHADVIIHNTGDAHADRLFAGLGETMHGESQPLKNVSRLSGSNIVQHT